MSQHQQPQYNNYNNNPPNQHSRGSIFTPEEDFVINECNIFLLRHQEKAYRLELSDNTTLKTYAKSQLSKALRFLHHESDVAMQILEGISSEENQTLVSFEKFEKSLLLAQQDESSTINQGVNSLTVTTSNTRSSSSTNIFPPQQNRPMTPLAKNPKLPPQPLQQSQIAPAPTEAQDQTGSSPIHPTPSHKPSPYAENITPASIRSTKHHITINHESFFKRIDELSMLKLELQITIARIDILIMIVEDVLNGGDGGSDLEIYLPKTPLLLSQTHPTAPQSTFQNNRLPQGQKSPSKSSSSRGSAGLPTEASKHGPNDDFVANYCYKLISSRRKVAHAEKELLKTIQHREAASSLLSKLDHLVSHQRSYILSTNSHASNVISIVDHMGQYQDDNISPLAHMMNNSYVSSTLSKPHIPITSNASSLLLSPQFTSRLSTVINANLVKYGANGGTGTSGPSSEFVPATLPPLIIPSPSTAQPIESPPWQGLIPTSDETPTPINRGIYQNMTPSTTLSLNQQQIPNVHSSINGSQSQESLLSSANLVITTTTTAPTPPPEEKEGFFSSLTRSLFPTTKFQSKPLNLNTPRSGQLEPTPRSQHKSSTGFGPPDNNHTRDQLPAPLPSSKFIFSPTTASHQPDLIPHMYSTHTTILPHQQLFPQHQYQHPDLALLPPHINYQCNPNLSLTSPNNRPQPTSTIHPLQTHTPIPHGQQAHHLPQSSSMLNSFFPQSYSGAFSTTATSPHHHQQQPHRVEPSKLGSSMLISPSGGGDFDSSTTSISKSGFFSPSSLHNDSTLIQHPTGLQSPSQQPYYSPHGHSHAQRMNLASELNQIKRAKSILFKIYSYLSKSKIIKFAPVQQPPQSDSNSLLNNYNNSPFGTPNIHYLPQGNGYDGNDFATNGFLSPLVHHQSTNNSSSNGNNSFSGGAGGGGGGSSAFASPMTNQPTYLVFSGNAQDLGPHGPNNSPNNNNFSHHHNNNNNNNNNNDIIINNNGINGSTAGNGETTGDPLSTGVKTSHMGLIGTNNQSLLDFDLVMPTIIGSDFLLWLTSTGIVGTMQRAHIVVVLMIKIGIIDLIHHSRQVNITQLYDNLLHKQWLQLMLKTEYDNLITYVRDGTGKAVEEIINTLQQPLQTQHQQHQQQPEAQEQQEQQEQPKHHLDNHISLAQFDKQPSALIGATSQLQLPPFTPSTTHIQQSPLLYKGISPFSFSTFRFRSRLPQNDSYKYAEYLSKFTKKRLIGRFFVFSSENLSLSYYEHDLDYKQRLPPTKQYVLSTFSKIVAIDVKSNPAISTSPANTINTSRSPSVLQQAFSTFGQSSVNLPSQTKTLNPSATQLSQSAVLPTTSHASINTSAFANDAINKSAIGVDITATLERSSSSLYFPHHTPPTIEKNLNHPLQQQHPPPQLHPQQIKSPPRTSSLSAATIPTLPIASAQPSSSLDHSLQQQQQQQQQQQLSSPRLRSNSTTSNIPTAALNLSNLDPNLVINQVKPEYDELKSHLINTQSFLRQQIIHHPSNFLTSPSFFQQHSLLQQSTSINLPNLPTTMTLAQLPQFFDFRPQMNRFYFAIVLHEAQYDEQILLFQCATYWERLQWLRAFWRAGCNIDLYPIQHLEELKLAQEDKLLNLSSLNRRKNVAIDDWMRNGMADDGNGRDSGKGDHGDQDDDDDDDDDNDDNDGDGFDNFGIIGLDRKKNPQDFHNIPSQTISPQSNDSSNTGKSWEMLDTPSNLPRTTSTTSTQNFVHGQDLEEISRLNNSTTIYKIDEDEFFAVGALNTIRINQNGYETPVVEVGGVDSDGHDNNHVHITDGNVCGNGRNPHTHDEQGSSIHPQHPQDQTSPNHTQPNQFYSDLYRGIVPLYQLHPQEWYDSTAEHLGVTATIVSKSSDELPQGSIQHGRTATPIQFIPPHSQIAQRFADPYTTRTAHLPLHASLLAAAPAPYRYQFDDSIITPLDDPLMTIDPNDGYMDDYENNATLKLHKEMMKRVIFGAVQTCHLFDEQFLYKRTSALYRICTDSQHISDDSIINDGFNDDKNCDGLPVFITKPPIRHHDGGESTPIHNDQIRCPNLNLLEPSKPFLPRIPQQRVELLNDGSHSKLMLILRPEQFKTIRFGVPIGTSSDHWPSSILSSRSLDHRDLGLSDLKNDVTQFETGSVRGGLHCLAVPNNATSSLTSILLDVLPKLNIAPLHWIDYVLNIALSFAAREVYQSQHRHTPLLCGGEMVAGKTQTIHNDSRKHSISPNSTTPTTTTITTADPTQTFTIEYPLHCGSMMTQQSAAWGIGTDQQYVLHGPNYIKVGQYGDSTVASPDPNRINFRSPLIFQTPNSNNHIITILTSRDQSMSTSSLESNINDLYIQHYKSLRPIYKAKSPLPMPFALQQCLKWEKNDLSKSISSIPHTTNHFLSSSSSTFQPLLSLQESPSSSVPTPLFSPGGILPTPKNTPLAQSSCTTTNSTPDQPIAMATLSHLPLILHPFDDVVHQNDLREALTRLSLGLTRIYTHALQAADQDFTTLNQIASINSVWENGEVNDCPQDQQRPRYSTVLNQAIDIFKIASTTHIFTKLSLQPHHIAALSKFLDSLPTHCQQQHPRSITSPQTFTALLRLLRSHLEYITLTSFQLSSALPIVPVPLLAPSPTRELALFQSFQLLHQFFSAPMTATLTLSTKHHLTQYTHELPTIASLLKQLFNHNTTILSTIESTEHLWNGLLRQHIYQPISSFLSDFGIAHTPDNSDIRTTPLSPQPLSTSPKFQFLLSHLASVTNAPNYYTVTTPLQWLAEQQSFDLSTAPQSETNNTLPNNAYALSPNIDKMNHDINPLLGGSEKEDPFLQLVQTNFLFRFCISETTFRPLPTSVFDISSLPLRSIELKTDQNDFGQKHEEFLSRLAHEAVDETGPLSFPGQQFAQNGHNAIPVPYGAQLAKYLEDQAFFSVPTLEQQRLDEKKGMLPNTEKSGQNSAEISSPLDVVQFPPFILPKSPMGNQSTTTTNKGKIFDRTTTIPRPNSLLPGRNDLVPQSPSRHPHPSHHYNQAMQFITSLLTTTCIKKDDFTPNTDEDSSHRDISSIDPSSPPSASIPALCALSNRIVQVVGGPLMSIVLVENRDKLLQQLTSEQHQLLSLVKQVKILLQTACDLVQDENHGHLGDNKNYSDNNNSSHDNTISTSPTQILIRLTSHLESIIHHLEQIQLTCIYIKYIESSPLFLLPPSPIGQLYLSFIKSFNLTYSTAPHITPIEHLLHNLPHNSLTRGSSTSKEADPLIKHWETISKINPVYGEPILNPPQFVKSGSNYDYSNPTRPKEQQYHPGQSPMETMDQTPPSSSQIQHPSDSTSHNPAPPKFVPQTTHYPSDLLTNISPAAIPAHSTMLKSLHGIMSTFLAGLDALLGAGVPGGETTVGAHHRSYDNFFDPLIPIIKLMVTPIMSFSSPATERLHVEIASVAYAATSANVVIQDGPGSANQPGYRRNLHNFADGDEISNQGSSDARDSDDSVDSDDDDDDDGDDDDDCGDDGDGNDNDTTDESLDDFKSRMNLPTPATAKSQQKNRSRPTLLLQSQSTNTHLTHHSNTTREENGGVKILRLLDSDPLTQYLTAISGATPLSAPIPFPQHDSINILASDSTRQVPTPATIGLSIAPNPQGGWTPVHPDNVHQLPTTTDLAITPTNQQDLQQQQLQLIDLSKFAPPGHSPQLLNSPQFFTTSQIIYPPALFVPYSIPHPSPRYLESVRSQSVRDITNFIAIAKSIIFELCHFITVTNDVYVTYWQQYIGNPASQEDEFNSQLHGIDGLNIIDGFFCDANNDNNTNSSGAGIGGAAGGGGGGRSSNNNNNNNDRNDTNSIPITPTTTDGSITMMAPRDDMIGSGTNLNAQQRLNAQNHRNFPIPPTPTIQSSSTDDLIPSDLSSPLSPLTRTPPTTPNQAPPRNKFSQHFDLYSIFAACSPPTSDEIDTLLYGNAIRPGSSSINPGTGGDGNDGRDNNQPHDDRPALQQARNYKFARSPNVTWVIERTLSRLIFFSIAPVFNRIYQILYGYKDITLQQRIQYYRTISLKALKFSPQLTFSDFLAKMRTQFTISPQLIAQLQKHGVIAEARATTPVFHPNHPGANTNCDHQNNNSHTTTGSLSILPPSPSANSNFANFHSDHMNEVMIPNPLTPTINPLFSLGSVLDQDSKRVQPLHSHNDDPFYRLLYIATHPCTIAKLNQVEGTTPTANHPLQLTHSSLFPQTNPSASTNLDLADFMNNIHTSISTTLSQSPLSPYLSACIRMSTLPYTFEPLDKLTILTKLAKLLCVCVDDAQYILQQRRTKYRHLVLLQGSVLQSLQSLKITRQRTNTGLDISGVYYRSRLMSRGVSFSLATVGINPALLPTGLRDIGMPAPTHNDPHNQSGGLNNLSFDSTLGDFKKNSDLPNSDDGPNTAINTPIGSYAAAAAALVVTTGQGTAGCDIDTAINPMLLPSFISQPPSRQNHSRNKLCQQSPPNNNRDDPNVDGEESGEDQFTYRQDQFGSMAHSDDNLSLDSLEEAITSQLQYLEIIDDLVDNQLNPPIVGTSAPETPHQQQRLNSRLLPKSNTQTHNPHLDQDQQTSTPPLLPLTLTTTIKLPKTQTHTAIFPSQMTPAPHLHGKQLRKDNVNSLLGGGTVDPHRHRNGGGDVTGIGRGENDPRRETVILTTLHPTPLVSGTDDLQSRLFKSAQVRQLDRLGGDSSDSDSVEGFSLDRNSDLDNNSSNHDSMGSLADHTFPPEHVNLPNLANNPSNTNSFRLDDDDDDDHDHDSSSKMDPDSDITNRTKNREESIGDSRASRFADHLGGIIIPPTPTLPTQLNQETDDVNNIDENKKNNNHDHYNPDQDNDDVDTELHTTTSTLHDFLGGGGDGIGCIHHKRFEIEQPQSSPHLDPTINPPLIPTTKLPPVAAVSASVDPQLLKPSATNNIHSTPVQIPTLPKEKESKPIIIAAEDLLILTVIVLIRSGDLDFTSRLIQQMDQVKSAMIEVEKRESALVEELSRLYIEINTTTANTVKGTAATPAQPLQHQSNSSKDQNNTNHYHLIASLGTKLTNLGYAIDQNSSQLEARLDALSQAMVEFNDTPNYGNDPTTPPTLHNITSFQSQLCLAQDFYPGPTTLASQLQLIDDFIGENERYTMAGYYLATTQAAMGLLLTHEPSMDHSEDDS